MPRKPALLLSLLNLVLKPIAGQTSAPSNQPIALPQRPLPADREAWRAYWQARDQPWRMEPEIDERRQKELAQYRAIVPDPEKGIYPFKGMALRRADVEWLLATLGAEGPVDWNVENQQNRKGLNICGADLSGVDLRWLPLARLNAGPDRWRIRPFEEQKELVVTVMKKADLSGAQLQGANFSGAQLQGASLRDAELEKAVLFNAQLQGAVLSGGHLDEADLSYAQLQRARLDGAKLEKATLIFAQLQEATISEACLEEADLSFAQLQGADLSETHLEKADLRQAALGNQKKIGPKVVDVRWDGVNLAVIEWSQVKILGEEYESKQKVRSNGIKKDREERYDEYQAAVRAYRQLAVALQAQGLNEDAVRFAYRAQLLQKRVFWFQMIQQRVKLRQRGQALGAWLFSWFLFLISGYGYRLWRSFLAYALVIIGFTTAYYLLGASFNPSLSLVNALGLSMTSFHGRGFFPGVTQLNDMLTILASIEAFVGLILEATFIATLTQRFFGK